MKGKNEWKINPVLHEQIHEIIERQIEENDPKETKETLERLMESGYNRHEAIHKIGTVLVEEIFDILKSNKPFNRQRYVKRLHKLK